MVEAPVVDSVLELIGKTPLVRLRNVVPPGAARVWAKAEHLNPGGSVKDRIAEAMLEGRLAPGQTVVEPTSGNTGIALAIVCCVTKHPLVLTMPASMSLERRQLLQTYGAEIVLTEPERVMEGAIEAAQKIAKERSGFMPMQFENDANPAAHRRTTAVEILEAFGDEPVHAFVAGVGTGGTISGVGRTLKAKRPETRVVAVEPHTSPVLSGGAAGPSKIQGLGAGFVPPNYDGSIVDEIVRVTDREAYEMKGRLAREEGLLVGMSSGASVFAAVRIAAELGERANVLTMLFDTGERYFSLEPHFGEKT